MYVWGTGAVGAGSDEDKSYPTPSKMWDFDGMRVSHIQTGTYSPIFLTKNGDLRINL